MQKHCEACGMPMSKKEDFAGGDVNSEFCLYCVNADGSVKTCEEIFEGGVQFFMGQIGGDRQMAEKVTRKNMNMQSYWQGKDCAILKGEVATDEEFAEALKKMR
jgi:radical SAM protein with 4Fe4S-binding SPASM domain